MKRRYHVMIPLTFNQESIETNRNNKKKNSLRMQNHNAAAEISKGVGKPQKCCKSSKYNFR